MDKILVYILLGSALLFAGSVVSKVVAFYWRAGYEDRKRTREQRRQEKAKWKYAQVGANNLLLERIIQTRFIIFKGSWGKGKSILMNLVAHYLYAKELDSIQQQLRYNKIMRPDYTREYFALRESGWLPIYSNLDFIVGENSATQLRSQELEPYIKLQQRAIQKAIFCIDEFSSLFPKELYYENQANQNPELTEMKEFFKKNRHYTNGWILGTEQDGEDMYKGFRKNGYALVTALGTTVSLPNKAKALRSFKNLFNKLAPACFTTNVKQLFAEELFVKEKIKLFFKLFLPSYLCLPKCYYQRKQDIHNKIKEKYLRFQTLLEYDGVQYYLRYTNNDIFAYDTRAYKHEYDELFDSNGKRKMKNESTN
jgi:hypothetical protein